MVFIWRGAGIIVPIIFFICGWIVSYWFEDTRLGNPDFIGWTCFYAALANTVIGIGLLGMSDDPQNLEPGEIPVKKRHDFFWIPVVVWGLIFGGFSAYLLIGGDDEEDNIYETEDVVVNPYNDTRTLNYYNPTEDTMYYLIEDRRDFFEYESVPPFSFVSLEYDEDTYLIAGFDYAGDIQLSYSDEDFVDDEDKYAIVDIENEDGSTSSIYHRIVNGGTKDKSDYDEAWVVLTGVHDLILVDVSFACADTITKGDIEDYDWMKAVEARYDGRDLVEPLYDDDPGNDKYVVMGPGETLPLELKKREVVFALIPIEHDKEYDNDYLIKKIIEVTF